MTIRDIQIKYKQIEIDILLEYVLNKPKEFIFANPNKKLTPTQKNKTEKLAKQRIKGTPIAYLTGYKYFYGKKFLVTKDTLIPRPETEQLVDLALAIIHTSSNIEKVLDIGTGSGCIAITLSSAFLNSGNKIDITASDISSKALIIAQKNSKIHKQNIHFSKSNLFSQLKGKYDLIIANLPYVPAKDYKKLKSNLRYEPKTALTDNSDNAKIYEKLLRSCKASLNENFTILLEIDPSTKNYISTYAKKHLPKSIVNFYKDLSGRVRFAEIRSPLLHLK